MNYTVRMVRLAEWLERLDPIFRQHYGEMWERMAGIGVKMSPYNPRVDKYLEANDGGWLLVFVLECDGKPVGYCNVYITNDMHNQDLIAQEDTIYVLPEHRQGSGRLLARAVHEELKKRGVLRMHVTTSTNMRVWKWLQRLGYIDTAHQMTINLAS